MAFFIPFVRTAAIIIPAASQLNNLVDYKKLVKNLKKKEFDWTCEDDDTEMDCTITLYTRSTDAQFGTHWALLFHWGSKQAVYEANEVDGYLIPSWTENLPDEKWEYLEMTSFRCSPRCVNFEARSVFLNGYPYIVTRINCQYWAIELGKKFGLNIEPPKRYSFGLINDVIDLSYLTYTAMRNSSDRVGDGINLSKASQPSAQHGSAVSSHAYRAYHQT